MKKTFAGSVVITAFIGLLIAGCCGGGTTVKTSTETTAPVGQQLIELQKAFESGAINEAEYKKLKKEAIEKATK